MLTTQLRLPAAVSAISILTLGIAACTLFQTQAQARPECPRDVIYVPRGSRFVTVNSIAGSGPISLVPEYHDCQRMLDSDRKSYGSLIAVFARYGLDTMPNAPQNQGEPGYFGKFAAGQAAATILNYDDPYDALGIEKGINCLYLYAEQGTWKAHIAQGNSDTDCLNPFNPAIGTDLNVRVVPGPYDATVPAVARWDWDPANFEHYIGIRCGAQWCEVFNHNRADLTSSETYSGRPLVGVKGWYDEQVLSMNPVLAGQKLVPSGVVGTIIPVGDLENNKETEFDSTWKEVAVVSLSDDSPVYKAKFNLVRGPAPLARSAIAMCKGDRPSCRIPAAEQITACDQTEGLWWARIVSEGTTKYHCVIRRSHAGIRIPGVVRWRWQEKDDDMWIRCPLGCCEIT